MRTQTNEQRSDGRNGGNGCVGGGLFVVAILLALLLGGVGGAMLDGAQTQRTVTMYPAITPAPETLMIAPTSAPVFVDQPVDPCANADPRADYAGWENGVGGQYPPCWTEWDRSKQNIFLRSH